MSEPKSAILSLHALNVCLTELPAWWQHVTGLLTPVLEELRMYRCLLTWVLSLSLWEAGFFSTLLWQYGVHIAGSLNVELTSVPTLTLVASHQDSGFLDAGKLWHGAAHWQPVNARISVASDSVSWGCFGLLFSQTFGAGWERGSRSLPPCWPMPSGFSPLPRSSQISGAGWLPSGALCWQGLDPS